MDTLFAHAELKSYRLAPLAGKRQLCERHRPCRRDSLNGGLAEDLSVSIRLQRRQYSATCP
jgi:hypothetical protein